MNWRSMPRLFFVGSLKSSTTGPMEPMAESETLTLVSISEGLLEALSVVFEQAGKRASAVVRVIRCLIEFIIFFGAWFLLVANRVFW